MHQFIALFNRKLHATDYTDLQNQCTEKILDYQGNWGKRIKESKSKFWPKETVILVPGVSHWGGNTEMSCFSSYPQRFEKAFSYHCDSMHIFYGLHSLKIRKEGLFWFTAFPNGNKDCSCLWSLS